MRAKKCSCNVAYASLKVMPSVNPCEQSYFEVLANEPLYSCGRTINEYRVTRVWKNIEVQNDRTVEKRQLK
jgi:hypothetical protein